MAEVQWIKLTTDMFDNRKIKYLRRLPEGNNIVLIWVMLLTMAGRCNAGGMIFLTENIPYTPKTLADELGFEENTVKLAIEALVALGMVRDDEFLQITGWSDHQSIEEMDKIREQNRIRKQRQRERERDLIEDMSRDSHALSRDSHATDKNRIDKNREEEIRREVYRTSVDLQPCMDLWNGLQVYGIKPVIDVTGNRYQALKDVIQQYGMDKYRYAIELISKSQFLQGQNNKHWVISFDWFLKNFARVLEGTYNDTEKPKKSSIMSEGSEDEWEAALRAIGR